MMDGMHGTTESPTPPRALLKLETALEARHSFPGYGDPVTKLGFVRGFCPCYLGKPTGAPMIIAPVRIWNQDLADARAVA